MARIAGPAAPVTGGDLAGLLQILASAKNPDGTAFSLPTSASTFSLALTSGVLLAAGGSVESAWMDAQALEVSLLHALRTSVGGTYALEIDWSRDGVTVDLTEALTPVDKASLSKDIVARFFRVRVRNGDGLNAFTAHRTTVFAR